MHQIERLINVIERHGVGDEVVNVNTPLHIPVYNLWHVSTATSSAKGRAVPRAPRYMVLCAASAAFAVAVRRTGGPRDPSVGLSAEIPERR